MNKVTWGLGALALLLASNAAAEPELDYRPRFEAPPTVRAKFDAVRLGAQRPVRRGDPVQVALAERFAEGFLVSVQDGMIMIRQPVDADRIEALKARGVQDVPPDRIKSDVICEDHYYVEYVALPETDLLPLAGREGRKVRLTLVRTEAMRYRVSQVSMLRP
ncbi:MAG: hypothetical protein RMA76_43760 [Deltaproteobacteria bacterium]|jgi:hypothetical protein